MSTSVRATSNFRHILFLSVEMTVGIGSFIYVIQNIENIDEATEPGFVCFAYSTSMFIYVWLISKKRSISLAIDKMETRVHESKSGIPLI